MSGSQNPANESLKPTLRSHLGSLTLGDGFYVSNRPCKYVIAYYRDCGHVKVGYNHRPSCIRRQPSEPVRAPHAHHFCENVTRALDELEYCPFDGKYPFYESGTRSNGLPRICPDSKSRPCLQAECEVEMRKWCCKNCNEKIARGELKVTAGHLEEHLEDSEVVWTAIVMTSRLVAKRSYFTPEQDQRRKIWHKQFLGFATRYITPQIPEEMRPVLYDPVDRKGFFTDVCLTDCDDRECPICMAGLPDDELVSLPCKHKFHLECIEDWLGFHGPITFNGPSRGNTTCPMCRKNWKALVGVPDWKEPRAQIFLPSEYGFSRSENRDHQAGDDDSDEEDSADDDHDHAGYPSVDASAANQRIPYSNTQAHNIRQADVPSESATLGRDNQQPNVQFDPSATARSASSSNPFGTPPSPQQSSSARDIFSSRWSQPGDRRPQVGNSQFESQHSIRDREAAAARSAIGAAEMARRNREMLYGDGSTGDSVPGHSNIANQDPSRGSSVAISYGPSDDPDAMDFEWGIPNPPEGNAHRRVVQTYPVAVQNTPVSHGFPNAFTAPRNTEIPPNRGNESSMNVGPAPLFDNPENLVFARRQLYPSAYPSTTDSFSTGQNAGIPSNWGNGASSNVRPNPLFHNAQNSAFGQNSVNDSSTTTTFASRRGGWGNEAFLNIRHTPYHSG